MHLLSRIGEWVAHANIAFDDGITELVEHALLDCLGCIYVGSQQLPAQIARQAWQLEQGASSNPQASMVFGCGIRANHSQAAMLNAVAGHSLDFDDWEIPGNSHPSVVVLPALLAVISAEHTGQQLAEAYAVAFEVIARLGEGMNFSHYDAGWHTTATLAGIGAAAGVSRLLGLSVNQTTHALSLAISQAVGYTAQFGSHAKPMQAGFAARAGVSAAYLAASGATAQAHMLEHSKGMPALMAGDHQQRLLMAVNRLGGKLAIQEYGLILKPWTSCGYTHRIMTAAIDLNGQGVDMSRVQAVQLSLPDFHGAILPFQQPLNRSEALFSLPFVAAMGLLYGDLTIADLDAEAWQRDEVKALISKTQVEHFQPQDPSLNYDPQDPDRLRLLLMDGQELEVACPYPLGAPQLPMTRTQIQHKFLANCQLTAGPWLKPLNQWASSPSPLQIFTQLETLYVSRKDP